MLMMYGGEAEDYLPEIELFPAIADIFRAFADLSTQWRVIASPEGALRVVGLDYSAIPFVLEAHGITDKAQALRDLRVLEAAALTQLNK